MSFGKVIIRDSSNLLLHDRGSTIAAMNFERSFGRQDYGIEVRENAKLHVISDNGTAMNFDRSLDGQNYGIEVHKNANLDVISNNKIIVSKATSPLSFITHSGAKVQFKGQGNNIIELNQANFAIIEPETIDFINQSNARLFSNNARVEFNIEGASVHGWKDRDHNEALPSYKTPVLSEGTFLFEDDKTRIIKRLVPEVDNFESNFPPTMPRLMFSEMVTHTLDIVVNDILEDDLEVSGTASPNVTVTMYNEENKFLADTVSDENGGFSIEFNSIIELQPGLILKFQSTLPDAENESRMVEKWC